MKTERVTFVLQNYSDKHETHDLQKLNFYVSILSLFNGLQCDDVSPRDVNTHTQSLNIHVSWRGSEHATTTSARHARINTCLRVPRVQLLQALINRVQCLALLVCINTNDVTAPSQQRLCDRHLITVGEKNYSRWAISLQIFFNSDCAKYRCSVISGWYVYCT